MSAFSGPNISNTGLVFYYDMSNGQKSWRGKPAINLQLPDITDWSKTAVVTLLSELSPIGTPVYSVTDNNAGVYLSCTRNITVPNDSNTYTISTYIKKTYGATSARLGFNSGFTGGTTAVQLSQRFNSDTGADGFGSAEDLGSWWRWQFQITNNSTGNTTLYCSFFPATGFYNSADNSAATGTAVVSSVQIEQNTFATPFVNGTRSNTQSLLDLTGQNTITATSLTYSSDGSFSFNGSSDLIIASENSIFNTQTPSVEVWIKTNALNQNGFWFEKGQVNTQYSLFQEGSLILWRMNIGGVTQITTNTASYISTSNWAQVVGTYTSGRRRLYINGVLVNADTQTGTIATNANGISIGAYGGFNGSRGYYYNGNIGIVKVYNKELTEIEVRQNFNALRGRYGL